MAITIPIVTDFDGRGLDRGIKQFGKLETTGQRAGFLIRKAALPAAAALAAIGASAVVAATAAAEDAAASDKLANQLDRVTDANNAALSAIEPYIGALSQQVGVADDELRPALGKLATATGNLEGAQKLLATALDVSAQTGKPLESVTTALAKAYAGNFGALNKLLPGFDQGIIKSKDFTAAQKELARLTGGAAAESADTAAGQFRRFRITLEETKESIGAALLPILDALLPILQTVANFAQRNSTVFVVLGGVFAGLAVTILAVNAAMNVLAFVSQLTGVSMAAVAGPVGIVVAALALLATGFVIAYNKSETFRNIVNAVLDRLRPIASFITDVLVVAFKIFIAYVNLLITPLRVLKNLLGDVIDFFKNFGQKDMTEAEVEQATEWLKNVRKNADETSAGIRRLTADFGVMGNKVAIAVRSARGNLQSLAAGVGTLAGKKASAAATKQADDLEKIFTGQVDARREGELRAAVAAAQTEQQRAEAQMQLDDFLTQQRIKNLRETAAAQAAAAEQSTADLAASFNLGLINAEQFKTGLSQIIGSGYGEELGNAFVTSFTSAIAETLAQLQELTGMRGRGEFSNAPLPQGIKDARKPPKKPKKPRRMATGGIAMGPTLALIGEAGPEAVIPLGGRRAQVGMGMTINIDAGLISTPDQIGQQIIEAIQSAQRRSGPVFAPA